MKEIWRPCSLVPGAHHIWVSNFGNVKAEERLVPSFRKGIIATQKRPAQKIVPYVAQNGYYTLAIKNGPERKKHLVHRLVALAFIPTKSILLSVNHIDCNKLNNHVDNLEWCTLAENTRMQWRDGLVNLRGDSHPGAKLKAEFIPTIRALKGKMSVRDIAMQYGVSEAAIYSVWQGTRWAHVV